MRALIASCLLVVTNVAHAEPEGASVTSHYVAATAMFGASSESFVMAGVVDGGFRLRHPLWLHAAIAKEGVFNDDVEAAVFELRTGPELRECTGGRLACFSIGADLGYQHATFRMSDMRDNESDLVVVPRATIDVGSEHLAVRAGFETDVSATGKRPVEYTSLLGLMVRW